MNVVYKGTLLLFIFFLIGCKKDKKTNPPPVITFNAPSPGQGCSYALDSTLGTYTMTINVNAQVSDNEHLASINVTLVDINHVPQQGSVNVPISSADFTFNLNYEVTQFRLPSGTYYIQVTASDGSNTTVAYQPIYIYTSPSILWGYCAVLKSNNKSIGFYGPSGNSLVYSIPLNQSYNGMKYGGYNAQLYVNGNGTQMPFQAFSMQPQSNLLAFTESANLSQQNYTCLYTDGNKPYVGFSNGDIYSYLSTSFPSTSYRYSTGNAVYPYFFTTTSLYGVGAFKNTNGTPDQLVAFNLSSGSTFQHFQLVINTALKSVVAIFEKAQDSLYVLGNDTNNNAVVYIYSPVENRISAYSFAGTGLGKMLSATKINNEYVLFSTATGVYSCIGLSLNIVPGFSGAQKLVYQPGLNLLTVGNSGSGSSSLTGYALITNTLSVTTFSAITNRTLNFGDSLIDFEVITNK